MKHLLVLAVLVINGQIYWVPCERGAVFCPHFAITSPSEIPMVQDNVYIAFEPAPSTIVDGLGE